MKKYYTILTILMFIISFSQQKEIAMNSCCDTDRGCTGSSSCSACSNCSGCKHCAKNGGSCGVCSGGSPQKNYKSYSTENKKKKSSPTKQNKKAPDRPKIITYYKKDDFLYVNVNELNVRKEANSSSKILEKLKKNSKVKFIKSENDWYKVEVVETKTIGYVYYKYVK